VLCVQALAVALKGTSHVVHSGLAQLQAPHEDLVQVLVACLADTTRCCMELTAQLPETPSAIMSSLLHPVMQPFETFMNGYARLEAAFLDHKVCSLRPQKHRLLICHD
jgi:hypothetical protein